MRLDGEGEYATSRHLIGEQFLDGGVGRQAQRLDHLWWQEVVVLVGHVTCVVRHGTREVRDTELVRARHAQMGPFGRVVQRAWTTKHGELRVMLCNACINKDRQDHKIKIINKGTLTVVGWK